MIFYDGVDLDMRESLSSMFKIYDFSVLYIRANSRTRCKCYNPLHSDGNINCPFCAGSGRVNTIELLPIIYQHNKDSGKLSFNEMGESDLSKLELYVDYTRNPKPNDKMLIVGFDKNKIPIDIRKVYNIESVEEVRGDNGRIEIYRLLAESLPSEVEVNQKRLNSIPLNIKKKIKEGRRYTWGQK